MACVEQNALITKQGVRKAKRIFKLLNFLSQLTYISINVQKSLLLSCEGCSVGGNGRVTVHFLLYGNCPNNILPYGSSQIFEACKYSLIAQQIFKMKKNNSFLLKHKPGK